MNDSLQSMRSHLKTLDQKVNKSVNVLVSFDFDVKKRVTGDWKSVPIIINSFNRLGYLKRQVKYLLDNEYTNIYIIDNNSTYLPLLEFYKESKLNVFYLSDNVGYLALWQSPVFDYFSDEYYVYTDSDVVPDESTPNDFIKVFAALLDKYSFLDKVGFSLKIDDLPEESKLTIAIVEHELKFWVYGIGNAFYFSPIDTTFALYRPNAKGGWWLNSGRTQQPYVAQHLPWYEDEKSLSEDDSFYYNSTNKSTHWSNYAQKNSLINKVKGLIKRVLGF